MKKLYLSIAILLIPLFSNAQFLITKNDNELGISGVITTLYNYDFLKPGNTDKSKNSFYLRDAQLEIEGKLKKNYEFKLHLDFANWISGINDPETPGFMDAYMVYKGLKFMDLKIGYQKLPYSRNSLVSFDYSPYFHRAEFTKGDVFSHRDIGITLKKEILNDQLKLFAGIYSGMGENSISQPNDMTGKPEYLARIEYNYPESMKYREIDLDNSETFAFSIGLNGRYAEKASYTGYDYLIKTINGKKSLYGFDLYGKYMGFSFSFEANQALLKPNTYDLTAGYITDYVKAGGWLLQANYYLKSIHSAVSARYDESNLNDLVPGKYAAFSLSYMYFLKHYDSVIRLNYSSLQSEEPLPGLDPKKWNARLILGWQFMFN
jgi:hypothetical protein